MYKLLMVKYGELGLKGKNKSLFINKLVKNIQRSLADLPERQVTSTWGRILIPVYGEGDMADTLERVKRVFGIYSISPALEVEKDMEAIGAGAVQVLKDALPQGGSFFLRRGKTPTQKGALGAKKLPNPSQPGTLPKNKLQTSTKSPKNHLTTLGGVW